MYLSLSHFNTFIAGLTTSAAIDSFVSGNIWLGLFLALLSLLNFFIASINAANYK